LQNEIESGHALPRLAVDSQGNLSVIWYDTRRDPANHNLEVFGTSSTDAGQHFTANYRVTDQSFDANAGAFTDAIGQQDFFLGDGLALVMAGGADYAAWTDTRMGNQEIFFSRFGQPGPAAGDDRFAPNNFPATATELGPVTVQQTIPRLVASPGEDDWYRVETPATGDLLVATTGSPTGQRLLLELWDSSGSKLLATGSDVLNAAGQIIGEQLSLPAVSGETYLVHVGGVPFDAQNSVPYALVLQSLTADLGTQVHGFQSGSILTGGQAIYRLAAAVTGTLRVRMTTGANFQGKADLQLLSADGLTVLASGPLLVIGNGNSGSGQVVQVSIPVTQGQAVLLQVGGGINVQNDFTLEFTNLDQFEEAQPSQGLLEGTTPGGSRVVYQLTVPQTGTMQAQVTVGVDFRAR
jgi:hypothetical protein